MKKQGKDRFTRVVHTSKQQMQRKKHYLIFYTLLELLSFISWF